MYSIRESDWKVLRRLKDAALQRFCERALAAIRRADDVGGTAHERYLRLYRVVQDEDRDLGDIFDDLKRSNAVSRLAAMRHAKLITDEEFGQFSDELRQLIVDVMRY